jgi:hypothetical protein
MLLMGLYHWSSQGEQVPAKVSVEVSKGKKNKGIFAFYNTENLFDTIDDVHTRDNDFLPASTKNWNTEKFQLKCKRLASLIDSLDLQLNLKAMGLCEIENENCLKAVLKKTQSKWSYYYFNTSDSRGIDQAFIFKEPYVKGIQTSVLKSNAPNESHFREIGFAKVIIETDTLVFLIHHWPSRMGGTYKSDPKRLLAAKRLNQIIDSLYALHTNKLIVMADFNDEPMDVSLQTLKNDNNNTWINFFEGVKQQGIGTVQYKSQKYLFDQILIADVLSGAKNKGVQISEGAVYHPHWLHYKNDPQLGPYRTYNGQKYHGGYSDHFPVYVVVR